MTMNEQEKREKVIKGLEIVWDAFNHMEHEMYADYVFDALALLKAQEPVVPIRMNHDENKYRDHYRCPICDDDLTYEQQYCAECGRAVKWE